MFCSHFLPLFSFAMVHYIKKIKFNENAMNFSWHFKHILKFFQRMVMGKSWFKRWAFYGLKTMKYS